MKKFYTIVLLTMAMNAKAQIPFYITSLGTSNSVVNDCFTTINDRRGGIALMQNNVYITGDSSTGVFDKFLGAPVKSNFIHDGLVCNISGNGGVYQMYDLSNQPMKFFLGGGGDLNKLVKLDPITMAPTASTITLSTPITLNNFIGIFSGPGYCLIQDENMIYKIDFATGLTTIVSSTYSFNTVSHVQCENGAYWGVAEYDGTNFYIAFIRNATTIESRNVVTSAVRATFSFSNLSNMCNFIASPWNNRWYFSHEGNSQFGGSNLSEAETVGSADMTIFGNVPLSIGFKEISAKQESLNTARVYWKVEKETEITNFQLEKMDIASNVFYKINEAAPTGQLSYTLTDDKATESKSYYRIKAIQKNGEEFYSTVQSVTNNKPILNIIISPNVASDFINILLNNKAIGSKLDVVNNYGQIVKTQNISSTKEKIMIQDLPIGFYHIRVQGDSFSGIGKFMKK
jgi:Secretion system C-terminal sorting domain